uniref:Leucine-rich repeat family protein / extensin family protein n=1 Tax=Solanum tuberosum TaxID=4113 RepID=M1BET0_SOLTU
MGGICFVVLLLQIIVTEVVGAGVGVGVGVGVGPGGVWFGGGINSPSPGVVPSQNSAYTALQAWKSAITDDPMGILKNWMGPNVCTYRGIFCTNSQDYMGNPTDPVVTGRQMQRPQPECSVIPGGSLNCLRVPAVKPLVCG